MMLMAESGGGGDASAHGANAFLQMLGARVRDRRALSYMSRRRLAELSGVSERYLAQLENGQGNMSIVLLRRVARAVGVPLAELVAEVESDRP